MSEPFLGAGMKGVRNVNGEATCFKLPRVYRTDVSGEQCVTGRINWESFRDIASVWALTGSWHRCLQTSASRTPGAGARSRGARELVAKQPLVPVLPSNGTGEESDRASTYAF